MLKPLTVWMTANWKILKEMGIPDHLTCLLRNLCVGQEATVRTGHGTTDWFQIGKGVRQGCILSPFLFNLYGRVHQAKCWTLKHKLESRLLGEVSVISDMHTTPSLWQKAKRNWRASWWKWKRTVKKLARNSTFKTVLMLFVVLYSVPLTLTSLWHKHLVLMTVALLWVPLRGLLQPPHAHSDIVQEEFSSSAISSWWAAGAQCWDQAAPSE